MQDELSRRRGAGQEEPRSSLGGAERHRRKPAELLSLLHRDGSAELLSLPKMCPWRRLAELLILPKIFRQQPVLKVMRLFIFSCGPGLEHLQLSTACGRAVTSPLPLRLLWMLRFVWHGGVLRRHGTVECS